MTHSLPPVRIEAAGLCVSRGGRRLIEDLRLSAGPGDYLEITGANGAGKTSLLRTLAGFAQPAAGSVSLLANTGPLDPDAAAQHAHVLGHRDGLKPGLSAQAHVQFWIGLLGGRVEALGAALERVGLARIADLPARALSAGQGRRLALARLIAVPRPLWLLDEPTASLDRAGKAMLAALITEHREAGGVVIAAVHEPLGPEPSLAIALAGEPA